MSLLRERELLFRGLYCRTSFVLSLMWCAYCGLLFYNATPVLPGDTRMVFLSLGTREDVELIPRLLLLVLLDGPLYGPRLRTQTSSRCFVLFLNLPPPAPVGSRRYTMQHGGAVSRCVAITREMVLLCVGTCDT